MVLATLPPTLASAVTSSTMSNDMKELITTAKDAYNTSFNKDNNEAKKTAWIVSAPGCINLIGDHTDYTNGGGSMIPFTINKNTICYGTGHYHTSTSNAATQISIKAVFSSISTSSMERTTKSDVVYERHISCSTTSGDLDPPTPPLASEDNGIGSTTTNTTSGSINTTMDTWMNTVAGTVIQFVPDIPHEGCVLDLMLSFCTNIPFSTCTSIHGESNLLSTYASIEVATSLFLECILHEMAYSSCTNSTNSTNATANTSINRALRCHRAETEWALNPCGIIDQVAASCTIDNNFLLFDTLTMSTTQIPFQKNAVDVDDDDSCPVFVICNSGIGANNNNNSNNNTDIEFGKRRRECHDAVDAIQSVPLYHVESLRDATVADLDMALAKNKLDDTLYKRSLHVITENRRVTECKTALKLQLYDKVGTLMNQSHTSLRDNFEVSCKEIDFLVDIAQNFTVNEEKEEELGEIQPTSDTTDEMTTSTTMNNATVATKVVYGSRMTGNGFGGCTISFVKNKKYALQLIHELQTKYTAAVDFGPTNKVCECFITVPSSGPHIIAVDTI
jgi:galactokinase